MLSRRVKWTIVPCARAALFDLVNFIITASHIELLNLFFFGCSRLRFGHSSRALLIFNFGSKYMQSSARLFADLLKVIIFKVKG